MPSNVQTPDTIAAAANALIPLVGTLDASGDPNKQAQGQSLYNQINNTLTQAANLASDDVVALLGNSAGPAAQLQKLDQQAKTAAAQIATDETKLNNAVTFLTSAVTFIGAVATGNAIGAATQLGQMLTSLNIH